MLIKELKAEGLNHTYAITVSKEDLADKLEAKIKEMQPQVSLKGFRPGKVPVSHIRKMYGQGIMKDVVEETINETTQKAINDNSIRPAGQPKVDLKADGDKVTSGTSDLEYELSVESIPDFTPVDPEKLKFTRLKHEPAAEDLAAEVAKLGEGQKSYKKKAKTAKAKKVMQY
jgi:trigger factor